MRFLKKRSYQYRISLTRIFLLAVEVAAVECAVLSSVWQFRILEVYVLIFEKNKSFLLQLDIVFYAFKNSHLIR